MSEPTGPFVPAIVTCHTPGCGNEDFPIEVDLGYIDEIDGTVHQTDGVTCGPCGQPITDVVLEGVGS